MTMETIIKTYSELITLPTFEERFEYLRLGGVVGKETFGFDRYINQAFYMSKEWKAIRRFVIIRDNGCDLGIDDREIGNRLYVHHMNPIGLKDVQNSTSILMDPEFLICASFETHNAIHYGDVSLLPKAQIERQPNDTCPWKR